MMASRRLRLLRLTLFGFALLHFVSAIAKVKGLSMVRRYKLDEEYPSLEQLKDLIDYDYSEEGQDQREESASTPVKRQQNQGGTCTCTCETKPVEEEPAKTQQASAGSLLRTGVAVKPLTASRVLEKPYQQKSNTENKNSLYGDYHSKVAKEQPWDYYGMEASKTGGQVVDEKKPEQPEVKSTASPEIIAESDGDQQDAWGHNRRYPWKHLPNTMCFRESCNKDSDCCMRYNLCDKSAKVCVDCWYGSICRTEQDCCQRFPYCKRPTKPPLAAGKFDDVPNGKCVGKE